MKRFFVSCVIFFLGTSCVIGDNVIQFENINCGNSASYSNSPYNCEFLCTEQGVEFDCKRSSTPGCQCNFHTYYNKLTKTCMEINCKNLDCVGKKNQAFFTCESGSRDSCGCSPFTTLDCRTGCMCKNGYCKKNGECVPRDCKGSPYDKKY
ncbi:hypothetical protein PVAND_017167 [Polypedilum vanderplanki]|uniref:Uncharacterized protein n=1 Tax=Polypedilum vanderplanki TaxID=319348 RepID=A0A9J6BHJ1_POLVA|nr:hypothetical protein PVAND_017167 [Polypedilum vanderplanki]